VRAREAMRTMLAAGMLAVLAAPAANAQSEAEQRAALEVFRDYAPDAEIDPCKHTADELKRAQDNIPPDIEQYAADYPAAIAAAIDARARGECDDEKPAAAAPATTPTPAATPAPAPTSTAAAPTTTVVPDPPEPDRSAQEVIASTRVSEAELRRIISQPASNDAPAPVLGLGILAGLLAVVALALVAARRWGVGDDRFAGPAHAIREARWRASGVWQDFLDWVRLGR
jgi:hypothetical protein